MGFILEEKLIERLVFFYEVLLTIFGFSTRHVFYLDLDLCFSFDFLFPDFCKDVLWDKGFDVGLIFSLEFY